MSGHHDDIPALGALREQLREAAARDAAPAEPLRRRRLRWSGLALVGAGLVTAGVAGAGSLISKGETLSGAGILPEGSVLGRGEPALFAQDPEGLAPWGVATYETSDGQLCVEGGQLRGRELGLIENGTFRPWGPGAVRNCKRPGLLGTFDLINAVDGPPRTLVYGRAREDVRRVVVTVDGRRRSTVPRHGGAFLFLFEGDVAPAGLTFETSR